VNEFLNNCVQVILWLADDEMVRGSQSLTMFDLVKDMLNRGPNSPELSYFQRLAQRSTPRLVEIVFDFPLIHVYGV
jgi:hypothetical protein